MILKGGLIVLLDEVRNGFLKRIDTGSLLVLHLLLLIERLSVRRHTWEMSSVLSIGHLMHKVHNIIILHLHQPNLLVNLVLWVIRNNQCKLCSAL